MWKSFLNFFNCKEAIMVQQRLKELQLMVGGELPLWTECSLLAWMRHNLHTIITFFWIHRKKTSQSMTA